MESLPWSAVSLVCTVLIGIYTWIAVGQRAHREQLADLASDITKRMGHLEQEVAAQSERLRHVPTSAQVSELAVAIGELRAEVRSVGGHLTAMSARLDRIEDYIARKS